jgi:hypothetical protein
LDGASISAAAIRAPELFNFTDQNGQPSYGGNQTWYATEWQRRAGCGPTVFAHLIWYMARTREKCAPLCPYAGADFDCFLRLMEDAWRYVTPGMQGVNRTGMFTDGARVYGAERNVPLMTHVWEVPLLAGKRPQLETTAEFITRFLAADLPVAFLNLSNGLLTNLDSWHWVTIVAYEPAGHIATMYDQSRSEAIDLSLWLRTTAFGGGFVALAPPPPPSLEFRQPDC